VVLIVYQSALSSSMGGPVCVAAAFGVAALMMPSAISARAISATDCVLSFVFKSGHLFLEFGVIGVVLL